MEKKPKELLIQDEGVKELLKILKSQNKKKTGEMLELIALIERLETKLDQVNEEIFTVKKQLEEVNKLKKKKSLKEIIQETVNKLDESCQQMKYKLTQIKTEVKEEARDIVQSVKEKGVLGLDKLAKLTKVKEQLFSMRKSLEKNISHVDVVIDRIDNTNLQLRKTIMNFRNIGRAFTGKEMANIKEKSSSSFEHIIKAPWKIKQECFLSMLNYVDAATKRIDNLSQKTEYIYEKNNYDNIPCIAEESIYNSELFEKSEDSYQKNKEKPQKEVNIQRSSKKKK